MKCFAAAKMVSTLFFATVLLLVNVPGVAFSAGDTLTTEQAALWVEDLEYLAENLPRLHYDAFNTVSENDFIVEVELLKGQIPGFTEDQVIMGFSRLISLTNDSHTTLGIYSKVDHYFPLQFGYFTGEGPRVLAVHSDYSQALLAEPTKVNGVPLKDIEKMLDDTFYCDNEMAAINKYPRMMVLPIVLNGLGVTDSSNQAVWSFRRDGREFDLTLPMVSYDDDINWATVFADDALTPMYRQQVSNPYYYMWNPNTLVLYFQYNACVERDDLSFDDFTYMLMDAILKYPFERFVIDLRHNGGGNSAILDPFIDLLVDSDKANQRGVLFVIIGRNTYSSAVLNSISLKKQTEAIFVGEPTGAKPNTYGELMQFTLPNSQLPVNYSTKYFNWSDEDGDAIYPEIEVNLSLDEFMNGHDPALDAILAY